MEDALVLTMEEIKISLSVVLILVLMEDALVLLSNFQIKEVSGGSLNPCFNGRCTRTFFSVPNGGARNVWS